MTVDPKQLLLDLSKANIALPELQVIFVSLLQSGKLSFERLNTSLDEALNEGIISQHQVQKIRSQLPSPALLANSQANKVSTDPDDAPTIIAANQTAEANCLDDDAPTIIATNQTTAESYSDDDATIIATPQTEKEETPDEDATVIAYPQNEPVLDDEAPTQIAIPPNAVEDDELTVISDATQNTSHLSSTFSGTTTSTGMRSWDMPGSTSPELKKLGPGSIIKDRFILDKVLGAGGMGKVFQARDLLKVEAKDANPYVAMKVLTEDFKAHPQAFIALQREASRQQKLAHPNIATVYDFDRIGMTGTQVFITMELLVGKPLDSFIRKVVRPKGGLPFEEALPIIKQLGASLSYAHQRNIVHSDFKPGNAFLCDDGTVKTLDFGIARAVKTGGSNDDATPEDDFDAGSLGALTPTYASLEMLQGKEPSTQDDLYALACVAYELLTGYHPFNRKSAAKAREAKLVPAPVKGLKKRQMKGLLHGLAFEKEHRTATVDEFLIELEGKANWHKNPWVLGSAFTLILSLAAYNPVMNQIKEQQVQSIIEQVLTAEPVHLENTLAQLPQLEINARNRITESGREIFQDYFKRLINEAVNLKEQRYDFSKATAELARMAQVYPDSVALNTLESHLELQRSRYLHQLSLDLNLAIENEWLLPSTENSQPSITETLSLIAAVAPEHSLLKDPRISDIYATSAQEAINLGDLEQAEVYLEVGMARIPNDLDLINTQDRLELAKEKQQKMLRINQLKQLFGEQPNQLTSLEPLIEQQATIIELAQLSPDDSALKALAKMAQPVFDAYLAKNKPTSDHQSLLLALNMQQLLVKYKVPTEAGRQRLEELLNQADLNSSWEAEVYSLIQWLDEAAIKHPYREHLAAIYLTHLAKLEENKRFSLAQATLARADKFALNNPELQKAQTRMQQEYKTFLKERQAAALQARIEGLKNNLLVETQAMEISAAEKTFSQLTNLLQDDDPFLTITAADAMAEVYLKLAENKANEGNYKEAVELASRGLEISPNDLLLQTASERYLVEANTNELDSIFQSVEHFDTPAVQKMLDEVNRFAPARYQELEQKYIRQLAKHILELADKNRRQGESLATRASILFPKSNQLAQLRAELAPAPWIEGRTARAALTTGRLTEAQKILKASKEKLPDHPEVLDFSKDLMARINQAEKIFSAYEASLAAEDFDTARSQLAEARQLWSDNPTYRSAIAVLSERVAQQRWQGQILQRDVDIRTLKTSQDQTGVDVSAQAWTPVASIRPCTNNLAGYGRRARAICFDMLHDRVRGPLMVVIPSGKEQPSFAISKYEISNEDYNKYCFFSGECPVDDSQDKNLPRTQLSYTEINAYTQWLSDRTGHTYRLPTANEWQHAAFAAGQQPPKDYNCRVRLGGQLLKGDQLNRVSTGHQNGWGLQNYIGNAQELVKQDNLLLALGGSYQDPHAECSLNFLRNHSGAADEVTGFRLLLEEVETQIAKTETASADTP